MADVLTAQNVDVAKFMHVEGMQAEVDKVQVALEENPVTQKLMEAAQTVEDVFQIVKEFAKTTLEDFKLIWDKTLDYFKNEKAELSDEVMDSVVGGWSFSSFWNKFKKPIIAAGIVVACVAGGIAAGAWAGPVGIAAGIAGGLVVGGIAAACYVHATNEHEKKNS